MKTKIESMNQNWLTAWMLTVIVALGGRVASGATLQTKTCKPPKLGGLTPASATAGSPTPPCNEHERTIEEPRSCGHSTWQNPGGASQ
jgi:hypothetical protein